jgi:hypothetical protein
MKKASHALDETVVQRAFLLSIGLCLWSCVPVGIHAADAPPAAREVRQWMDNTGGFRVEAAFAGFAGERVKLQRADGREIATPIARLSPADQAYLRRHALADEATASWPSLFAGPGEGLRGEYYRDMSLDEVGAVRTDGPLDFTWSQHVAPYQNGKPPKETRDGWPQHFAVRWTGLLVPRYTERYTLSLEMDDGAALWIGDRILLHQWEWKGKKEYTANIDLVAGRPYPLRILYYNGWFGGGLQFRWSSPSQPKELVPRECLFLPAMEKVRPASQPPPSLAERLAVQEIAVPAPVKCDSRHNRPALFLCPAPDGKFQLGWTDTQNRLHVTTLAPDLRPAGKDVATKGDLRGMTVDAEGRMTLLLAEMPDRMWLMHFDASGSRLWHKCLVGEQGRGANQHYLDEHFSFTGRLAAAGNRIAAHFAHSWNTGKSGVHQGGYFTLVERDGRELQEEKWTVSHSLDQRLLDHGGCWFTLSAGDCYPKGLHLQNRTVGFGRVIYPEPAQRESFGNCGGFVNAQVASLVPAGADLATAFITQRDGTWELCFLRLAPDCMVSAQKTLASLPNDAKPQVVKLAPYRDSLLVAWRESEAETKLALIDGEGNLLAAPETVPHALPAHDDLLVLPNGDVGWLGATPGEKTVRLIRIASS